MPRGLLLVFLLAQAVAAQTPLFDVAGEPAALDQALQRLTPAQRSAWISERSARQLHASPAVADRLAFELAVLGHAVAQNTRRLVQRSRGCATQPRDPHCDEDTFLMLLALYHRGQRELWTPIVAVLPAADGALAALVGAFLQEELTRDADRFLNAVDREFPGRASEICRAAAGGDGGGMDPALRAPVESKLRRRRGLAARACLVGLQSLSLETPAR